MLAPMALPPPAESSTALVTGASSGIGVEIARGLAARGHGVWLTARREERLRELGEELEAEHGIRADVFACDLGDATAREELVAAIGGAGLNVEVLVNNAGFGGHGRFIRQERGRDVGMVRVNVEALTDLTVRWLPAMVERGRGAVLNVASIAAFQPLPGTATYGATKAFVLSQSEALHAELKGTGVTVTAVCPGPVKTEFAQVAGVDELAGRAPEVVWTSAEEVATAAIEALEAGRRTVVPGVINRAGALAGRLTPRGALLPVVRAVWGR